MRVFKQAPGPHAPQLAIQAFDLNLDECQLLRSIVTNNYIDMLDYKVSRAAGAFLQGYNEPEDSEEDGWVLVEFWTDNATAIEVFVQHVNARFMEKTYARCPHSSHRALHKGEGSEAVRAFFRKCTECDGLISVALAVKGDLQK